MTHLHLHKGLLACVLTGSFAVCCVPSKGLPGDERKLAAVFRQVRVVERRAGFERNPRRAQEGGGGLGVAQVALGVSIEGSRGSRICGGRVVRRGHGEISWGNNRKANWFWQVWRAGSNAVLLKGRWGNIQQNYEIIRGAIQERGEGKDPSQNTGPAEDPEGPVNRVNAPVRPTGGVRLKEELNIYGKVKVVFMQSWPYESHRWPSDKTSMKQSSKPCRRRILYRFSIFSVMNKSNEEKLAKWIMHFMTTLKTSLETQRLGKQTDGEAEKQTCTLTDRYSERQAAGQTDNTYPLSSVTHLWNQASSPTAGCLPDQLRRQPARQTPHSSQHGDRLTQSNQLRCLNTNRRLTEFWARRWR